MSAPQIPNLLKPRGGPRLRAGRGRARGGSSSTELAGPRVAPNRKDLDIQATDTDAAVARLSAVDIGYLDDIFAPYFVNGPGNRRMPIINRGTYTRTAALDILINAFLSPDAESLDTRQTKQIISLGAGTDTRYLRLRKRNKHHQLIYHEFDFPSVCASKFRTVSNKHLIDTSEEEAFFPEIGPEQPVFNDGTEWGLTRLDKGTSETVYCCHPLDLRTLPYAHSQQTFRGIRRDTPTLIISECCLCYLEVDTSKDIIRWFTNQIPSLGIALYEPIGVDDSFGQMMVANLAARGITMPSLDGYKTLPDQKSRLAELGFEWRNTCGGNGAKTIAEIWEGWISATEKERVDRLEGLDEVEEWQLLARHYCVAWGWRGERGWDGWSGLSGRDL